MKNVEHSASAAAESEHEARHVVSQFDRQEKWEAKGRLFADSLLKRITDSYGGEGMDLMSVRIIPVSGTARRCGVEVEVRHPYYNDDVVTWVRWSLLDHDKIIVDIAGLYPPREFNLQLMTPEEVAAAIWDEFSLSIHKYPRHHFFIAKGKCPYCNKERANKALQR